MAEVTARSGERPNRAADRRPKLRLVGAAGPDESIQPEVISAPLRVASARPAELLGISPIAWLGALGLFGVVIAGASVLGWHVVPPEAWPQNEVVFRVVFEEPPAPLAPAPVVLPDLAPVIPAQAPAVADPKPPPVLANPELPPALPDLSERPKLRVAAARPPAPPHRAAAPAPQAAPAPSVQEPAVAIVPPRPISAAAGNRKPLYPIEAERRRQEGKVTLRVEVSAAGEPLSLSVEKSSGHDVLDQAAMAAVRQWRFNPATQGGRPVAGTAEVPIDFRIAD